LGVYLLPFKILTFTDRKWLVFPAFALFGAHVRENSLEFLGETYPTKTRGWGYHMVKNA